MKYVGLCSQLDRGRRISPVKGSQSCYFGAVKRFALLLILPLAFGADPEVAQRNATALIRKADQALAANRIEEAEGAYKAAIEQCDLLPPDKYHCKTDVQWKLGRLYGKVGDVAKAEAVYKSRVTVLEAHQEVGERPDLDLGIALFDLESVVEGGNLKSTDRDADGLESFERARTFYEHCKADFPDLNATCDHRLADVEGFHGSVLLLKRKFDAAAPFLKSVVDRPDSVVRREVLTAALRGYATILISRGQPADAQALMERVRRLESAPK